MANQAGAGVSHDRYSLFGINVARTILATFLVLTLGAATAPTASTREAGEPTYTFVSMPDFLNADIGNTRLSPRWDRGDPNSINTSYREAIDVILDAVQDENPDSVLVAGDLVEGHWGSDVDDTRIFGRVNTFEQRMHAVTRAGNLYYSQWARRYAERGLLVHPAVGDHEIGDNWWHPGSFKYRAVPRFKRVWAKHFTASGTTYDMRPTDTAWQNTAYATYLSPDLLLVTVDVFKRSADGVHAMVTNGQLKWLDSVLAQNSALGVDGAKWVIVQGHTPVLGPVRESQSSGLYTEKPEKFWATLRRHDVTAYFNGEVHTVTMRHDGVTQISHGNGILVGTGPFNYLIGKVYGDRIETAIKRIPRLSIDRSAKLWHTTLKRPPIGITYAREALVTGTAVLTTDDGRIGESTGELVPVTGDMIDQMTSERD